MKLQNNYRIHHCYPKIIQILVGSSIRSCEFRGVSADLWNWRFKNPLPLKRTNTFKSPFANLPKKSEIRHLQNSLQNFCIPLCLIHFVLHIWQEKTYLFSPATGGSWLRGVYELKGQKLAVMGAGPIGLRTALELALLGAQVPGEKLEG